jgi:uncharacterized phage-associated protein
MIKNDYPASVFAVANWFIKKSQDTNKPITHMQLQKLVYMAYGWYYACYEIPLFCDDIVAWKHGPVIPSLYVVFKDCGRLPITYLANTIVPNENGYPEIRDYSIRLSDAELQCLPPQEQQKQTNTANEVERILEMVWRDYSDLTAGQLRNLTHRPDTPWGKIFESTGGRIWNTIIEPAEIQKYFDNLIQKYGKDE